LSDEEELLKGKVIFVDENNLTVDLFADSSSCESCSLKHSCVMPDKKSITVKKSLYNEKFVLEDIVEVDMKQGELAKLSFVVYMIPLFLMMIGGISGIFFSEIYSIIGGFTGLLCGLILLIAVNKKVSNKRILTINKKT